MNQSPEINELVAALATAQGALTNPEKNKTANAGKFSYKYADLADVVNVIRGPLSKNGLAYVQTTTVEGTAMFLETKIMHKSGQWISGLYPVCSIGGDHQKMGGSLTYSRRYALLSILGIVADEDTDGIGAAEGPTSGREQQKSSAPTQEQVEDCGSVKTAIMACKTVKALTDLAATPLFGESVAALHPELASEMRREWSDRKAFLADKEERKRVEASNDELTGGNGQGTSAAA